MKTCSECRKPKPLDAYHRQPDRRDGHAPRCKTCTNAARAVKSAADREAEQLSRRERAAQRAADRMTLTPGACHYPGCSRTANGLCATHHMEVANSRESPLDIGGQWVKTARGARTWVA